MTSPTLYHGFACACGYIVNTVNDFEALDRLANSHSRKCKHPSTQTTQTTPFVFIPLEEDE